MPTIRMDGGERVFVHDDAVAAALVTLKIEITDATKLQREAERIFCSNEAKIGVTPTEGEIDSLFGTPESPDIAGCLNFLFPASFPGGDVMDIAVDVVKVVAGEDRPAAPVEAAPRSDEVADRPVTWQDVLDGISAVVGAPVDHDATRASLKHLRSKGFPSPGRGSGKALTYTKNEFILILVAYELMSVGLTPTYASAIVTANADEILADRPAEPRTLMVVEPRAVNDFHEKIVPTAKFIGPDEVPAALNARRTIFIPLTSVKELARSILERTRS